MSLVTVDKEWADQRRGDLREDECASVVSGSSPFLKAGLLVFGLALLIVLRHYGPLRDWFSFRSAEAYITSFRSSPVVPLVVTGAFVAGGLLRIRALPQKNTGLYAKPSRIKHKL